MKKAKRAKRARDWKLFRKSHGRNGQARQGVGHLPAVIPPAPGETSPGMVKITSAFDGDIDYPTGGYGDLAPKAGVAPEHHLPKAERAKYEKSLRKKTRKARRLIRALESGLWIGRSLAKGERHKRVPHWRDWQQCRHRITHLRPGDGRRYSVIRMKIPRYDILGKGLDVESRAQMNARFAEFIGE